MSMKRLLYYTAFGDIYRHFADLSIKSVQPFLIDTDLFVITDKAFGDYNCIVVSDEMTPVEMMCFRANIEDFVNIQKYDQVWFCDTDIIFKKNVFTIYENEPHIKVCRESWTTLKDEREWFGKLIPDDEFELLQNENGINGGFWMIPRRQYKFFREYKASISYYRSKYDDISADQQALNYIYYCKQHTFQISTMPLNIECFPARQEYKDHYFKHYACYPNEEKKVLMNKEMNK